MQPMRTHIMSDDGASLSFLTNYKWFLAQNNLQKRFGLKKRIKKKTWHYVLKMSSKIKKSIGLLLLQIQSVVCISIPQLLQIWKF
jgi:hypothetical protein